MAMTTPEGTHVLGEATLAELREQVLGPVITQHHVLRTCWFA